jgi:hypothetical protein
VLIQQVPVPDPRRLQWDILGIYLEGDCLLSLLYLMSNVQVGQKVSAEYD